ncbi:MAG: tRNA pseudouridine(55) synthase TruB [Candidatus Paceibacterota bacterium]|jgi:tRNA pseudouridine55 synthase
MNEAKYKKGIYGFWKPRGPSSFDVIREIKKSSEDKCIGHAGTLDPLAEGVLVIAIGKEFTRKISEEVKKEKEYIAHVRLGIESSTDDEEGEKIIHEVKKEPTQEDIEGTLQNFIGIIMQTPPIWSAVKVRGKEAYKRAEQGEEISLKPRSVRIDEIEIISYQFPELFIRVATGSGVYIRSLARDIGKMLKTYGYLTGLIRTKVGGFTKENSIHVEVGFQTPKIRN